MLCTEASFSESCDNLFFVYITLLYLIIIICSLVIRCGTHCDQNGLKYVDSVEYIEIILSSYTSNESIIN